MRARPPRPAGDIPTLGPPLPGDLGRPILAAGRQGAAPAIGAPAGEANPERQALSPERDPARTSHLFAADEGAAEKASSDLDHPMGSGAASVTPFASAPAAGNPARLTPPASPYVVQAGAVIPAALVMGLRSDLPGQVIAQVTQNLYDSLTGRILLAPQGSKLIGTYESQLVFGQSRVFLAWTRLILPNGKSLDLPREPGADIGGYAGLQDSVDHHWRALFGAAMLSAILAVGTQTGASDTESARIQALRQARRAA